MAVRPLYPLVIQLPHVTARHVVLVGDGGERTHVDVVEDRGKDQVVEVLAHAVLDVVEAELLGVELVDALTTVLVDKANAALVVAAAAADADELEQRGALVQDLEGPWKKSQVLMVQESICSISCTLQMLRRRRHQKAGPEP